MSSGSIEMAMSGLNTHCLGLRTKLWRCGLVMDTWLQDQEVPGSSPGCARSMLSP